MTLTGRLLQAVVDAGAAGITRPELLEMSGSTVFCSKVAVQKLRKRGLIFSAGPQKLNRYYATQELADAAAPVLQAQFDAESKQRATAYRERKNERDRNRYRLKGKPSRSPKQKAQMERIRHAGAAATPWRLEQPTKRNTVKPRDLPIVIPPHVRVQRLPHGEDRRFTVDPSHRGEFSLAGIGRYIEEQSA